MLCARSKHSESEFQTDRQTDRQANKDVIYYDRDRDGTQNVCVCVFLIIALLQPSFLPFNNLWNKKQLVAE